MNETYGIDKTIIDLDEGLGRVRGNKKVYRRMLGLFLKSAEFDALEDKLAAGDVAGAADVAHSIKGMTGNLSLVAVFDASTRLMQQLREGNADGEAIEQYRAALRTTMETVETLAARLDEELA